jgi:hypothetical protein
MKMQCHKLLNIPTSIFIENTHTIPRLPKDKNLWVTSLDPKLFLTTYAYNKLSTLENLTSLIFEMESNVDKKNIHIDLLSTLEPVRAGLNIILEGQGVMKWFVPESKGYIINRTTPKISYKAWFNNYGEPVDIWDKGKIALVKTDVAHQVWNYEDANRFIISMRWSRKLSWEETIDWFNKNFPDS